MKVPRSSLATVRPADAPLIPLERGAFEAWGPTSTSRWSPAAFPDGRGGTWTWAEPSAKVRTLSNGLEIDVARFTRKHDEVQIFDNPKHLLACSAPIRVPADGIRVQTTLAATMHNAPTDEWGDGFASFNLMDFEHGLVLDGLANNKRTAILFERLFIPGMIPQEQSFTTIADGPTSAGPGQVHTFDFQYEPQNARIRGWIDGTPVLDYRNVPFRINQFTAGVGLITLRPITNGTSTSLRGQGATGRFGPVRTSTTG